jgi:hypothetical protein
MHDFRVADQRPRLLGAIFRRLAIQAPPLRRFEWVSLFDSLESIKRDSRPVAPV